jgi:SAM-dependent methyltransferase
MGNEGFTYQGSELVLFAEARNWKAYFAAFLRPYVGQRVLEVGAGLGNNIGPLISPVVREWVCLEPDASLADQIQADIFEGRLPEACRVSSGTIAAISDSERFDTILYVDVLEHIEDDRGELHRAAKHLADDGHLVVLAPAHQALFSSFDTSIGHFRRYNRRQLEALTPSGIRPIGYRMLDSCGLVASLANRLFLRQSEPSHAQIAFWDNCLVRLSRIIDPLTRYTIGKTVVMIWQKERDVASAASGRALTNDSSWLAV